MPVAPTHPERYESQYDTSGGRLAERHPNSYPTHPPVARAYDKLATARAHLGPWMDFNADVLPPAALEDVVRAYEALSEIEHELPRIMGYVCCYKLFPLRDGAPVHYSDFSAHESREEAERWLVEWERTLPRPEGVGTFGPWEIQYKPARVIDFRAAGLDPARFIRR